MNHNKTVSDLLIQALDQLRNGDIYPQNNKQVLDMGVIIANAISEAEGLKPVASKYQRKREAMNPGLELKSLFDAKSYFFWNTFDIGFDANIAHDGFATYTTDIVYDAMISYYVKTIAIPKETPTENYINDLTNDFVAALVKIGIDYKLLCTPSHPTGIIKDTIKDKLKVKIQVSRLLKNGGSK